ncbi:MULTISPECIES: hypothetical protein [Streptomyces]|uniref:Uncharacterized protein n=1 Tax=Streptomyces plicatus TaxID=1922 RepID=A0ABW1Y447_STRPL|nr:MULTISPECIES: hypothetical protein [Streptomyces]MBJ6622153.1 hypothetical protein [Streptomyces sp. DHE17-7]RIH60593.1 hypothetical protein D3C59_18030 [Streptomyces sp. SHP22-7]GHC36252.1 hypothetical protein GCM10010308_63310 [Streptomyces vinaceusdrappus]
MPGTPESLTEDPASVEVVYVGQEQPESWDAAVYLCGPTPTDPEEPFWRPSAVAALRAAWDGAGRLAVFLPDPTADGSYPPYADQIAWEEEAMRRSDVPVLDPPGDEPAPRAGLQHQVGGVVRLGPGGARCSAGG